MTLTEEKIRQIEEKMISDLTSAINLVLDHNWSLLEVRIADLQEARSFMEREHVE